MYYEDKGFRYELAKLLQEHVNNFFRKEHHPDVQNDQLTALATYNILQLTYVDRRSLYAVDDFKIEAMKAIKHFFTPANEHDLLAIRLEQLSVNLILRFGKEFIDEVKEELFKTIIESKPINRFLNNSSDNPAIKLSKSELKERREAEELFQSFIKELFEIFPSLWLIPFLNEAFINTMS